MDYSQYSKPQKLPENRTKPKMLGAIKRKQILDHDYLEISEDRRRLTLRSSSRVYFARLDKFADGAPIVELTISDYRGKLISTVNYHDPSVWFQIYETYGKFYLKSTDSEPRKDLA